jgi:hypothetical protein
MLAIALILGGTWGCSGSTTQPSYGGAYKIATRDEKIEEFDAIRGSGIDWTSSKVQVLTDSLFIASIKSNATSGMLDADKYQRYNYVVKGGEILVAVWTSPGNVTRACSKAGSLSSASYGGASITTDTMINFFPEDVSLPLHSNATNGQRVCEWRGGKKPTGVLDGHSKHFMLAQGAGKKLTEYEPGKSGNDWARASVDYAGEIIVDVKNCNYVINQNSGTYRPKSGDNGNFRYLYQVADLFAKKTGVKPAAIWHAGALHPTMLLGGGQSLGCN